MYSVSYVHDDAYPGVFRIAAFRKITFAASIVFFAIVLALVSSSSFAATSGTFNQSDWSGGAAATNATHPGDQNSWTTYSSKDATLDVINAGADLDLGTVIRARTHTTDTDFKFNTDQSQSHTTKADFSASGAVVTDTLLLNSGSVVLAPDSPITPTWSTVVSNIFTDYGSYSAPTLVDLDGDGLLDIMFGEYANSNIYAFRNTGTATAPTWSLQSSWNLTYSFSSSYVNPVAGDFDGDGDYDLLVGLSNGQLWGFENTNNTSSPTWTRNTDFDGPDMSTFGNQAVASPAVADLDNDGDLDLVVGVQNGFLYAFENSSATNPDWSTTAPATWVTGDDVGAFSSPALGDLNGDGLYDLIVGTNVGTFWAYPNIGTSTAPDWGLRETTWEGGIDVGSYATPVLGDVNTDGFVDLVTGNSFGQGRLFYFTANTYMTTGTFESPVIDSGLHYGYTTFQYTSDTTPVGTSISVDVRAGDTPTFDGSWVTLSAVASGVDISSLGARRYFQYVVTMATTDTSVTPTLSDATVGYLKFASGTDVTIVGSGADAAIDLSISWAASSSSQYDVFSGLRGRPTYRDGYLYSADDAGNSNSRFRIIDVSDPAAPVLAASTSHGHRIYDVAIDGNYAYVAVVTGLAVVDISTPASPVTVGSVSTPGWTYSVVKVGNYVYAGSWQTGGLKIFDVSDPANPAVVSSYDTVGNATFVSYVNGYVYLSDGTTTEGMLIFDVSDPADPQLVNSIITGGVPGLVAVKGNIAYMGDSTGLRIYDVTDPTAPVLLATSSLVASSSAPVEISGNLLYTAGAFQAKVLDITDPVAPTLLLSQPATTYSIYSATADKNYMYTIRGSNGIEIFNLGPYSSSGEYHSELVDFGAHLGFTTLNYTTTLPAGTTLAVDVRAGDSLAIDGSWTAWQSDLLDGADISTLATRRYLQYRVRSATTDTSVTPSLNDITFNYTTYADPSELISSPYNTTDSANLLGSLGWNETLPVVDTDVQLQIRTAADNVGSPGTWSSWTGPDGTSGTFWNSANTHSGGCSGVGTISCTTLPPSLRDALDDQWIQYRVVLVSSFDNKPVVADVSVTYDAINIAGSGIVNIGAVSGPTSEPSVAATFDVSLGNAPTGDVTILLQSTDLTEGVLSTSSLLFNTSNWSTPQTVTITGQNDDVDDGDIAYQILLAAAVSSDPAYDDKVFPAIAMTNNDDDVTGTIITPNNGVNTTEVGGTLDFTVRLTSEPTADVTIGLTSSDLTEGTIDTSSMEFTPLDWATPQSATVTGVDDVIIDPATAYSIQTTVTASADPLYAAHDPVDVSLTNTDNDVAGVIITAPYGYVTSENGGFTPMTVKLTSMPTAAVTFTVESDDGTEGSVMGNPFGPTPVTIQPSSWNTGASIIVRGLNDSAVDGDVAYNITTSTFSSSDSDYNLIDPADIAMTNLDNESYTVSVSTTSVVTNENGGMATFRIALGAVPSQDVTINLSVDDSTEATVFPLSITFPAGSIPTARGQTITVTGLDDRVTDGTQAYTVQTAMVTTDTNYSPIDPADVSGINHDNNRNIVVFDPDITDGRHGTAVAMADINCDGISDLLVGGEISSRGDVSVYYGNGSGFSAERDQRIYTVGSRFANAIVNLGDVNGDSCDDVAVGEYNYSIRGRVHIYYGSATGFSDLDSDGLTEAADAALFFYSTNSSSQFGYSLVADDFDADGDTDLVISAPQFDSDQANEGRVFLYKNYVTEWTVTYGADRALWPVGYRADGWLDPDNNGTINVIEEATWDWAFEADQSSAQLGWGRDSMTSINVNGDAYPDLVIGARLFDNGSTDEGRVFLFNGSATGFNDADADKVAHISDADWMAESDKFRGYFGSSVANAGDIDGNGIDDLLIGAGQYSVATSTSYEGAVFLFKASNPGGLVTAANADGVVRSDTESDWSVVGPYNGANYGYDAVASAGDFDGDGFPDIIIGGPGRNPSSVDGGVYVYLNDRLGSLETTAVFSDKDRKVWSSADYLGTTVGTMGDINGDGLSDIYASGINIEDDIATGNEGAVFLYMSNVQTPGVTVTPTTGLETTESGGTATFTVVLDAPFTAETDTLDIDVTSLNTAEGTVSPAQLTFEITNWGTPQTVTVTGANDAITDGNIPYTVDLAAVVTTDSAYAGLDPTNVSVTNLDNDITSEVAVTSVGATEGGIGTITFERSGEITNSLTVDFSISGTASGNDFFGLGTSAEIPAGSSSVTVNVQTTNDARNESDETIIVSTLPGAGYSIGLPANTTLTITDNDTPSIRVLPTTMLTTNESGGSATFSVTLTSEPSDNVTITLSSDNVNEGVITPNQLVFTPAIWGAKFVTVIGVDDGNTVDGDVNYNIVTSAAISNDTDYDTVDPIDVAVRNRDNDNAAVPRVTLSATNPTFSEAGSGTFTVTRIGDTTSSLRVFYSVSGTAFPSGDFLPLAGSVDILTGNNSATVTITALQDVDIEGDETVIVRLASASDYIIDRPSLETMVLIDDDSPPAPPLANFWVDQSVGEGSSVSVGVELSDDALSYPVTIPYTVSGTATNPADHNASDNDITIASGTSGSFTINIEDDGPGDNGETVIITMGAPTNAQQGNRTTHTVTTTEVNETADATMTAVQNSQDTRLVITGDGNVTVTAVVSDPNPTDTHSYNWSATNASLVDIPDADDTTFVFDPSGLTDGFYKVRLTVTDNGTPNIPVDLDLLLEVLSTAPVLSGDDSDGDGIIDSVESFIDSDGDGLADYIDSNILSSHELQLHASSGGHIMRTEPGLTLRLGDVAFAAEADGAYVTSNDIIAYGGGEGAPGSYTSPDTVPNAGGGYVDFEIADLPNAGQSVRVVIPQENPLPAGALYRKYHPVSGWATFVENGSNSIASAMNVNGDCPLPGSTSYTAGLTEGHDCVQLTIQDGGPNDMDGQANRVIEDPAQIGKVVAVEKESTPSGGGGGGGVLHPLWLLLMLGVMWRVTLRRERCRYRF